MQLFFRSLLIQALTAIAVCAAPMASAEEPVQEPTAGITPVLSSTILPIDRPVYQQLGDGFLNTTVTLTNTLTDTVRTTVSGTATLAGSVTGIVADTVTRSVVGTADVAGKMGVVMADGVKTTVAGTSQVAGKVGGFMVDGMKTTMNGTLNVAGTVGGAVADSVKSTAFGTARVAGAVTHVALDTAGSTVTGAVRIADAVGSIVAGAVTEAARTLIDAPRSMLDYATSLIGTPYKWGGTSIDNGLDCSGFVQEVVKSSTGKKLPRTAKEMSSATQVIDKTQLKPGDLVFFNTRKRPFSHVGIYLGNDEFVHGASGKKSGKQVRIDKLSSSYYTQRFNGARRLDQLD